MFRAVLLLMMVAGAAHAATTPSETDLQLQPILRTVEETYAVDNKKAHVLLDEAHQLIAQQPAVDAEARLRGIECWIAAAEKPSAEAITIAEASLAFSQSQHLDRWTAEMQLCRGYIDELAGHYDEALPKYHLAVAEGRRLGETQLLADALSTRADLYSFRGNFADAMADYQEAYPLFVSIGRERNVRGALGGIANLYSRLGEHTLALEYFKQLLTAAEKSGEPAIVGAALISIGHAYSRKGDHDLALATYQRAWELYRKLDFPGQHAVIQQSLGSELVDLSRPAEALPELDAALLAYEKLGDTVQQALTRTYRGQARQQLGKPSEAMADFDFAIPILKAHKALRYLATAEKARTDLLAANRDWPAAYESLNAYHRTHLDLDQQLREETTAGMRVQFDSEKKEQDNLLLQKENAATERIRGLQSLIIGLSSALLVVLGYLAYKQVKAARRMHALALTDELTGLPNRRHILTYANDQIALAKANRSSLCALVFDVDYFKRVNDGYGHLIGDKVLGRIADACNEVLREGDKLGRTGGEEFLVIFPGIKAAAAMEVAERLRIAVDEIDCRDLHPDLHVTISLGVAQWEPGLNDIAQLSHRADNALYRAKERGRNRTELATHIDDSDTKSS